MTIKDLKKHKNFILLFSMAFAVFVMTVAGALGIFWLMFVSQGYLLFMFLNNWTFVVGKKDDIDELLDAQEDYKMIRICRREA